MSLEQEEEDKECVGETGVYIKEEVTEDLDLSGWEYAGMKLEAVEAEETGCCSPPSPRQVGRMRLRRTFPNSKYWDLVEAEAEGGGGARGRRRRAESSAKREERLARGRERVRAARAAMSDEARAEWRRREAERTRRKRREESEEARRRRLSRAREAARRRRRAFTEEERSEWRRREAERVRRRRSQESPASRRIRLSKAREAQRRKRDWSDWHRTLVSRMLVEPPPAPPPTALDLRRSLFPRRRRKDSSGPEDLTVDKDEPRTPPSPRIKPEVEDGVWKWKIRSSRT